MMVCLMLKIQFVGFDVVGSCDGMLLEVRNLLGIILGADVDGIIDYLIDVTSWDGVLVGFDVVGICDGMLEVGNLDGIIVIAC